MATAVLREKSSAIPRYPRVLHGTGASPQISFFGAEMTELSTKCGSVSCLCATIPRARALVWPTAITPMCWRHGGVNGACASGRTSETHEQILYLRSIDHAVKIAAVDWRRHPRQPRCRLRWAYHLWPLGKYSRGLAAKSMPVKLRQILTKVK